MKADLLEGLAQRAEAEGLLDVAYAEVDSPIGTLLVASTPKGVVRLSFPSQDEDDVLDELATRLSPLQFTCTVPDAATMNATIATRMGDTASAISQSKGEEAVGPRPGSVWVVNRSDGTLSQIDPATGSVKQTIPVGRTPAAVAVGHDAVWVASSGDGTLTKVDPVRVRVVKRVQLSNAPEGVAVGSDGVYVTVRSTGRAHRGVTLRIDTVYGPDYIDPALGYTPESWSTLNITNDGLVAFRRVAGV